MFKIEADVINNHVRELVLTGKWPDAQRFLKRTIPGMSTEQAYHLMSGNTRLINVAVNQVDFIENTSEKDQFRPEDQEYQNTLQRRFTGVLKTQWGYYKPYAYVSSFGFEDLSTFEKISSAASGRLFKTTEMYFSKDRSGKSLDKKTYLCRPLHYADDPESDLVFDMDLSAYSELNEVYGSRSVLFKKIPEIPPWMDADSDPSKALDNWMQVGSLKERGFNQSYGIQWQSSVPKITSGMTIKQTENIIAQERAESLLRQKCIDARKQVLEQMENPQSAGWIPLQVGDTLLKIPQAPFEHWALDRCGASHLALPWKVCSVAGLKKGMEGYSPQFAGDDPMHTDWMLGAGLDPRTVSWYGVDGKNEDLRSAAEELMRKVQEEKLSFKTTVLANNGVWSGKIFLASKRKGELPNPGEVVVLPDARASWLETVISASDKGRGAIIIAKGGALAHLIVETRAAGSTVVLDKNAEKIYKDGQLVTVDPENGLVKVFSYDPDLAPDQDSLGYSM